MTRAAPVPSVLPIAVAAFAIALFVGMAAGVYSSVFIATPLLAHLKSNETEVVEAERRARARKRAQADKYASVPVFKDDLPVRDEGDLLVLRHAEVLQNDELYTRTLRAADATDRLVLAGGDFSWEPRFTIHGYRYAEAADLLDIPISTLKNHLHRGSRRLRKIVERQR